MKTIISCLFLVITLNGCSKYAGPSAQLAASPDAPGFSRAAPGGASVPAQGEAKRYIASVHEITLASSAGNLQKQFAAIQAECLKLGCDILEAKQTFDAPHQPDEATLVARVPPQSFDTFLATTKSHGKILSHHSASEDKTAQVIDVEAKIKNLEALRDRVKELLAKRTGDLKETLDAEKQLAETQSELDSINGQRRMLALQTDMVRVKIDLVVQTLAAERSFAAPVSEALKESGTVFMYSLGALITLLVGALPWVALIVAMFFAIRRIRRARSARIKPGT